MEKSKPRVKQTDYNNKMKEMRGLYREENSIERIRFLGHKTFLETLYKVVKTS